MWLGEVEAKEVEAEEAEAAAAEAAAAALARSGFLRGCRVTCLSRSGLPRWKCGWCHPPGLVFLKLYALSARTHDEYCARYGEM